MRALLDRPPTAATPPTRATSPDQAEAALAAVDRGLHLGAAALHAGVYLGFGWVADHSDFGPHLLAGILCGDFAGWLLGLGRNLRSAPWALVAEVVVFVALFALWWSRYELPTTGEFRALFTLGGIGALTGRVGALTARRREAIWD